MKHCIYRCGYVCPNGTDAVKECLRKELLDNSDLLEIGRMILWDVVANGGGLFDTDNVDKVACELCGDTGKVNGYPCLCGKIPGWD